MQPTSNERASVHQQRPNFSGRIAPCIVDGCSTAVWCRRHGFCLPHYRLWKRHGDPSWTKPAPPPCLKCGGAFTPGPNSNGQKYCSQRCAAAASWSRNPVRERRRNAAAMRQQERVAECKRLMQVRGEHRRVLGLAFLWLMQHVRVIRAFAPSRGRPTTLNPDGSIRPVPWIEHGPCGGRQYIKPDLTRGACSTCTPTKTAAYITTNSHRRRARLLSESSGLSIEQAERFLAARRAVRGTQSMVAREVYAARTGSMLRRCPKCRESKSLESFSSHKGRLVGECHGCVTTRTKRRRLDEQLPHRTAEADSR